MNAINTTTPSTRPNNLVGLVRWALGEIKRKDAPVWAQFFKYGICGGLSAVLLFAVVIGFKVLAPAFAAETLPAAQRNWELSIVLFCAFVPSNVFAYVTNRMFVFTPGRHSAAREFWIFTFISALSFAGGEIGKRVIVDLGYNNIIATFAFVGSSALVNFVARKFLVFER